MTTVKEVFFELRCTIECINLNIYIKNKKLNNTSFDILLHQAPLAIAVTLVVCWLIKNPYF